MVLFMSNCEKCGIETLYEYKLCDICIFEVDKDTLTKQEKLWKTLKKEHKKVL